MKKWPNRGLKCWTKSHTNMNTRHTLNILGFYFLQKCKKTQNKKHGERKLKDPAVVQVSNTCVLFFIKLNISRTPEFKTFPAMMKLFPLNLFFFRNWLIGRFLTLRVMLMMMVLCLYYFYNFAVHSSAHRYDTIRMFAMCTMILLVILIILYHTVSSQYLKF